MSTGPGIIRGEGTVEPTPPPRRPSPGGGEVSEPSRYKRTTDDLVVAVNQALRERDDARATISEQAAEIERHEATISRLREGLEDLTADVQWMILDWWDGASPYLMPPPERIERLRAALTAASLLSEDDR